MDADLPLEVQARLASLSHEIQVLDICELRKLFMQLAKQKAEQEQIYSYLLNQATKSERRCYCKLAQLENKCEEYRTILAELQ